MPFESGTLGQLWLKSILPPDVYQGEPLDKKNLSNVLSQLAQKHPDKYRDVTFQLNQLGRHAAYFTGGNSFGLDDLRKAQVAQRNRAEVKPLLAELANDDSLDQQTRRKLVIGLMQKMLETERDDIYEESLAENNPIAMQLKGAGRGNKFNLAALRGSDGLYEDHRGRTLPVPILRSYSEGLTPIEYLAGTFGARRGLMETKFSVADAGFFGKQLVQAAHRLQVEALDADKDPEQPRGLPVDVAHPDNPGSLLALEAGGYPRNTVLTPKILRDIEQKGTQRILVRSPIAFGTPNGGVYARDVGIREFGRLPNAGERVGVTGGQAVGEPLSQAMLCLAEGTLVRMADGSVKCIEDISVGDMVLGANDRGFTSPTRVLLKFKNGPRYCVETVFLAELTLENGVAPLARTVSLISTPDHKLLGIGNSWRDHDASLTVRPVESCVAAWLTGGLAPRVATYQLDQVPTYDIMVDNPDHLFVLANGLIVSNSGKHSGGVAGASGTQSLYEIVNAMVQVPETIKGGGTHARVDGVVRGVEKAPAGGNYVYVGNERHFVAPGFKPQVKPGDVVEAGDMLSDGLPNPAVIVEHKGVGEGRRYFLDRFYDVLRKGGVNTSRRNVELLARGLVNHVRLTQEMGDYGPDDVVPYSVLEHAYQPRENARLVNPRAAIGKYLEQPYLHYTIGTKIRPSMLKDFEDFKVPQVLAHDEPPPFEPEMVRGMANLKYDPDWMVRQYGSYLQEGLLDAAQRGATADERGTSFVPALAKGVNFKAVQPGASPTGSAPPTAPFSTVLQPRSTKRIGSVLK